MPLIACPDCGRKVSDRAKECPDCCCPVAELVGEQKLADDRASAIGSRELVENGEVDCPACEARGWRDLPGGDFGWCLICEHSGRTLLARSADGYFAIARYAVSRFLAGELHPGTSGVVFHIGPVEPSSHKYPAGGKRVLVDEGDARIPWETKEA